MSEIKYNITSTKYIVLKNNTWELHSFEKIYTFDGTSEYLLSLLPLLEHNYSEFKNTIQTALNYTDSSNSIFEKLPLTRLVDYALSNNSMHWIECACNWLLNSDFEHDINTYQILLSLNNRDLKIPQAIQHKIKKILAKW